MIFSSVILFADFFEFLVSFTIFLSVLGLIILDMKLSSFRLILANHYE